MLGVVVPPLVSCWLRGGRWVRGALLWSFRLSPVSVFLLGGVLLPPRGPSSPFRLPVYSAAWSFYIFARRAPGVTVVVLGLI